MYTSAIYITTELFVVLMLLMSLVRFPLILKMRHLLMVLSVGYIWFISDNISMGTIWSSFKPLNYGVLIGYCIIPSLVIGKLIIQIHRTKPGFLTDATKIINFGRLPRYAPLITYPLLSVPLQEIIFRWFYVGRLEQSNLSTAAILLISSVVFGVAHISFKNKYLLFGTTLAGIWWGALYIFTGNVLYPIISHAILGNILIWLALYKNDIQIGKL